MQLDKREFVEIVMRQQNRIYRFILSMMPNYSEAEELCQQTVVTLWEKWENYDADEEFIPWAFGIARNHVYNHLRKRTRRDEQVGLPEGLLDRIAVIQEQRRHDLEQRREVSSQTLAMLRVDFCVNRL